MSNNPVEIIDSVLADYISPRARRALHALITLVGIGVSIYVAVDGNWEVFVGTVLATLYAAANKANTPAVDLDPAGVDSEIDLDDGLSYEEAGGGEMPEDEPAEYDYDEVESGVSGNDSLDPNRLS